MAVRRILAAVVFVPGLGRGGPPVWEAADAISFVTGCPVEIAGPSKVAPSLLVDALPTTAGRSSLRAAGAVCEKRGKRWAQPAAGGSISELFGFPGADLESGNTAK